MIFRIASATIFLVVAVYGYSHQARHIRKNPVPTHLGGQLGENEAKDSVASKQHSLQRKPGIFGDGPHKGGIIDDNVRDNAQDYTEPWKICTFANWAQYSSAPWDFWPEHIDVDLCTHIYYAFSDMFENKLVFYEVNDEDLYNRVNALKAQKPSLKTVLSVGGWTFGTSQMTLMLASKANRTEFIIDVIDTLTQYGFNGIDLWFEYPGTRGSPPQDKYLFTCLCKEMREAFDVHNVQNPTNTLIMTATVPHKSETVQAGYEIEAISIYLDKVILDGSEPPDAYTNIGTYHQSPLDTRPGVPEDMGRDVPTAVNRWINGGCPPHKLILGTLAYGRGFTLVSELNTGIGAPYTGYSTACNYTRTAGSCAYYELCLSFIPFADLTFDPLVKVPYGNLERQWYGYEDPQSLTEKVSLLISEGLGGFMFWIMSDDDFRGTACKSGRYPLLTTLNNAILGYLVPVPDTSSDPIYCEGRPDGYYQDPNSCERYYQCFSGQTTVVTCQPGTVYDPFFIGCRDPSEMDQSWICNNCVKHCVREVCDS